ncbi:nicotinamide-nucleotide amidohydrolase family protein [Parvibaculum sp.]|uniref:CinA family protein n=3 Tax=Parvibaculum sp. TaxID=2024848 RepID=UPI000C492057|nr:nicotinamide-nucleotide amidohydrolase family protein [Parvibaculum sp.]MAU60223.1 damage-inducible protein CinA [Parvibaculum sp.]MBO6667597.1 nicotinamide-nucleotide amidohydrolase family protein [Parvibaculum sp.]MBO6714148.1 nicotinamide-nucleotide amidohydrolase family protein [Parvibaculum sp.]
MEKVPSENDIVARANAVMRRLTHARLSVITAESCSGGLVCAVLSQAEGAGSSLQGGFIAYTKQQKEMSLGVPAALLAEVGSVAPEVARLMAEGALARSPADIALVLTGVVGPAEDEDGNPVGRVVFACGTREEAIGAETKEFGDIGPEDLRRLVVMHSLELLDGKITGLATGRDA